jgi:rhodanese-related sulfurtransferase
VKRKTVKMMRYFLSLLAICFLVVASLPTQGRADQTFPLRAEYPDVRPISIKALDRLYESATIVDVRAKLEYDVIHMSQAINIPVAHASFESQLEERRSPIGNDPLVFYCNGFDCAKAYEAARKAMTLGFPNVYAYDAGIENWVVAHPEKTTLMGESPARKEKLISGSILARHTIGYAEFKRRAERPKAAVIDIREPVQRKDIPPFPRLRNIPTDLFIQSLNSGEFRDDELLIFDAVGRQVVWLQYYLEKYRYRNYYFLRNGASGARKGGGR